MADDERQAAAAAAQAEEEADVGPSLPPEGLEGGEEEEEGADVGPIMPKPKKRKVGRLRQAAGGGLMRQSAVQQRGVAGGVCGSCQTGPSVVPLVFLVLQVLEYEQQYLAALPLPEMYEKSYMHRDTGTAPICCSTVCTCLPSMPLWSAAGMPLA